MMKENTIKPVDYHCPILSARDSNAVAIAAEVMRHAGVVAYPTETSYALGCSGLDRKAVARVYAIKGRGRSKPFSVIMADARMVSTYTVSTPKENALVKKFMPGPLTIVAKKRVAIPASGTARTIAFRIPSNEFARELSAQLAAPIVSTSANLSGESAIYDIADIVDVFAKKVDLIIDAGNLAATAASTIVCLLGTPKIIREGAIPQERVLGALKAKAKKRRKSR
jgi:tRNA threonylcarbamoyl adenosine modification protein (Sua5/YciO/YrdC/YwlC family)